jgi:transcriptional regulator with XRE-family HTH domain
MARTKTSLSRSPPYPVDEALRRWGSNLRTARLARNLTLDQVAEKIGAGTRAVADAEKGRPGTSAAVYVALLWTYDLIGPVAQLADPATDVVGLASASATRRQRARARIAPDLDRDF